MPQQKQPGLVVSRLVERIESIADTMLDTYRQHIDDYDRLTSPEFDRDVRSMSVKNLTSLLAHLEHGRLLDDDELAEIRASAARRVHQGVPLNALLHAYRLWGEVAWEEIVAETESDDSAARDAAMRMAGRLIQQLNLVSTELTRGYLTEMEGVRSDRDALRRELVEVLIGSPEGRDRAVRLADALSVTLAPRFVAIVAALGPGAAEPSRLARAATNRRALAIAQHVVESRVPHTLVTLRHEHLIVLVPGSVPRDGESEAVAQLLAGELGPLGFVVGVGGFHHAPEDVRASYREAVDALDIAATTGELGRPVEFERILVDAILRGSPLSERLVAAVLGPLRHHDERGGELEATLTAYIDSGFSVARSARQLNAHANTVVYRLQKIHEVCGRDPRDPDDLAAFILAVRAARSAST